MMIVTLYVEHIQEKENKKTNCEACDDTGVIEFWSCADDETWETGKMECYVCRR